MSDQDDQDNQCNVYDAWTQGLGVSQESFQQNDDGGGVTTAVQSSNEAQTSCPGDIAAPSDDDSVAPAALDSAAACNERPGVQDSQDYKEGYQAGLSGDEANPGPRSPEALQDYQEGFEKGRYDSGQQSPTEGDSKQPSEDKRPSGPDSEDYKEGYQTGLSGDLANPGPRSPEALQDYQEGFEKGYEEFREEAKKKADEMGENVFETAKEIAIHKGIEEAAKYILKVSGSGMAAKELAQAVEFAGAAVGLVTLVIQLALGELGPGDTGLKSVKEFPFYALCNDPHGNSGDPWAGRPRTTFEQAEEDAEQHNKDYAKYSTHHARARSRPGGGINEEGW